ncbi:MULTISPECIES: hypothetical protein [unclassified Pseudoalteromonas]|uniref:hypothetical protein n=1 Tax=unclassified Pseudoalteromonas TaxID=194690 RepID=UPI000AADB546|nr:MULTISPECIES: hypothetical protein [unclassified Pseudoalteromonas]
MHPFSLEKEATKEVTGGVLTETGSTNSNGPVFPPPLTGVLGEQGSGLPPFGGYE